MLIRSAGTAPAGTRRWLPDPVPLCRIPSFVKLAQTVRANRERIVAAVELGVSNSKLGGLNSKIRLINHRGYGHQVDGAEGTVMKNPSSGERVHGLEAQSQSHRLSPY